MARGAKTLTEGPRQGVSKAAARSRRRAESPSWPEPPALVAARANGDPGDLAIALLEAAEETPLFQAAALAVVDWLSEAAQLAERVIADDSLDTRVRLRRAEAFLASGTLDAALMAADDAASMATGGLRERALLVSHRCLTRLGRAEDARRLFERLVSADGDDDEWVPGLALLAQAEARLMEGHVARVSPLLERALAWLPPARAADRLRYDALVALALADHIGGVSDAARLRFARAAELADAGRASPEAAACRFLSACMGHAVGGPGSLEAVHYARGGVLAPTLDARGADFPTDRIVRLCDADSPEGLRDVVFELARTAGEVGELASYVLWCRVAATLYELEGRADTGLELLDEVSRGLAAQGHAAAAASLAVR